MIINRCRARASDSSWAHAKVIFFINYTQAVQFIERIAVCDGIFSSWLDLDDTRIEYSNSLLSNECSIDCRLTVLEICFVPCSHVHLRVRIDSDI